MAGSVKFGSKLALVLATVGSAVGLGNVWRFPNEVQENGGAAFLIVYIGCILLMGIPVMLAEFSLGRGVGSDSVGAFKKFTPKSKWWLVGGLGILASFMIAGYYMVVAGWTIEYLWMSITGSLYEGIITDNNVAIESQQWFSQVLSNSTEGVWSPIIATIIILLFNMFILLRGVKKGIEKMTNMLMPLLFVLMLILCVVSLSLPKAADGIDFFLNPDFSKINPDVFMSALGQAFFSLSLGMGTLITYASYFPKKDNLSTTAVSVSFCDFAIALLMGFIIFPAVTSFGLAEDSDGLQSVALIFVTLPEVFVQIPYTQLWSIIFFLLLFIAAITSTVSILEVSILFLQERLKFPRKKAVLTVVFPLFIISFLCSLSQGALSEFTICGLNIFDFLDTVATNYMLPIGALLTCVYVGWVIPKKFVKEEITNKGKVAKKVYPIVIFLIRYVAPLLILSIFVYQIITHI